MTTALGQDTEDFFEDPETLEMFKPILEEIRAHFIAKKISEGLTREEIIELIQTKGFSIDDLEIAFGLRLSEQWTNPIKEAISNKNYEMVAVLSGVQVEHVLNLFFYDILEEKFRLAAKEIYQILNSVNMPGKLGWLLTITTECEISEELKKDLMHLIALRNKIAHYKPIDIDDDLFSQQDLLLLDKSSDVIKKLDDRLIEIHLETFPEYEQARTILREEFNYSCATRNRT